MIWSGILVVASLGGAPLYDADPDHPWNAVHRVFYVRRFTTGEVYEHDAALDPPWSTWSRFYNDKEFHNRVLDVLDRFLKQPEEAVERQPALRRAILLRDLWPVFDAQTNHLLAKADTARLRQQALGERIAKVMRRLELSIAEVQQLPDALRMESDRQTLPTMFNPQSPDSPFLPPDLFDADGSWLPFAARRQKIAAVQHLSQAGFRSVFVPFVRASPDRQATLEAMRRYSDKNNSVPFPNGTMTALVRRTMLPTTSGEIVVTPLVESLQLAVADQSQDRRFKFVIDRAALLAGGRGLRAVTRDEALDAWGFGNPRGHDIKYDADGDELMLGMFAGSASRGYSALARCGMCHHAKEGRLFANSAQSSSSVEERSFDEQVSAILARKSESESWRAYQTLRRRSADEVN